MSNVPITTRNLQFSEASALREKTETESLIESLARPKTSSVLLV